MLMSALCLDLLDVEIELLALENISVSTSALARARCDLGCRGCKWSQFVINYSIQLQLVQFINRLLQTNRPGMRDTSINAQTVETAGGELLLELGVDGRVLLALGLLVVDGL